MRAEFDTAGRLVVWPENIADFLRLQRWQASAWVAMGAGCDPVRQEAGYWRGSALVVQLPTVESMGNIGLIQHTGGTK